MSISVQKLHEIITIAHGHQMYNIADVQNALKEQDLLPDKYVKEFMEPKIQKSETSDLLFASKQAKELASKLMLDLEPGNGTAKNGKYCVADINKIAKPIATAYNISKPAVIKANELDIPLESLNFKGSGANGKIILSDVEALNLKEKNLSVEVKITREAKELAETNKLDLMNLSIVGTGKLGKIVLGDIRKIVKEQSTSSDDDSEGSSSSSES